MCRLADECVSDRKYLRAWEWTQWLCVFVCLCVCECWGQEEQEAEKQREEMIKHEKTAEVNG